MSDNVGLSDMIRNAPEFRAKEAEIDLADSLPRRRIFALETTAEPSNRRQNEDADGRHRTTTSRGDPAPLTERPPPPISPRSPKRRAITPATPAPKTPGAPMTPTGGSLPPGCAAQGLDPLPPDPQTVGLYLAACMEGVSPAASR